MERKVKVLIVTGCDDAYAPWVRAIACRFGPYRERNEVRLACLNLGLSDALAAEFGPLFDHTVQPGWDLSVPEPMRLAEPHLRALTARPFLRDYFPGYDVYLWIDADVVVQEPEVARWYVQGALERGMALVPQVHYAYQHTEASFQWRMRRLAAYFGEARAREFAWATYYNAGVFALTAGAPHWRGWEACFREGLQRCGGVLVCDQTALNEAVRREHLGVTPLPASANWLCHLAMPVRGPNGLHVGPGIAREEIGFAHFSAGTKASIAEEVGLVTTNFPVDNRKANQ